MAATFEEQTRATVEELSKSLRTLVRSGRTVADAAGNVIERELAMAVHISEALRDDVFSKDLLERARKEPLPARFRQDLHSAADVVADLGAIAYQTFFRFVDSFADALVGTAGGQSQSAEPKAS